MTAQVSTVELQNPRRSRLRGIGVAAKIAFTVTILGLILSKVGIGEVWSRITQVPIDTIVLVLGSMAFQTFLAIWRWRIVIGRMGATASWRATTRGVLVERFLNQALPSTVGGDIGRILDVTRAGVPTGIAVRSVLFDRALALGGIVLLIALMIPFYVKVVDADGLRTLLCVLPLVCVLGLSIFLATSERTWSRILAWQRFRVVADFVLISRRLLLVRSTWIYGFGLSIGVQVTICLTVYWLARQLNADMSFMTCLALVPAVTLFSFVPLSIAGWGAREGAMVVLLAFGGVANADAVAISVLLGLGQLTLGILGGGLWLALGRDENRSTVSPPQDNLI